MMLKKDKKIRNLRVLVLVLFGALSVSFVFFGSNLETRDKQIKNLELKAKKLQLKLDEQIEINQSFIHSTCLPKLPFIDEVEI